MEIVRKKRQRRHLNVTTLPFHAPGGKRISGEHLNPPKRQLKHPLRHINSCP